MLIRYLLGHRADMAWLAAWSLVQALPAAASGWSLAEATARFLAGHAAVGLAWLGGYAAVAIVGALGAQQAYLRAAAIVEPLRDDLIATVVDGALARSTSGTAAVPDTRSVARLTHQAEIVRDSVAGVLIVSCSLVCSVGSAVVGLLTLVPATLPYVVPPLLATMIAVWLLLRPAITRQRAAVLTEEQVAEQAARAVSGVRDITACGAEDRVLAGLREEITGQARAARAAAWIGAARLACLAAGGWLPLLLVLAAAPSMLGHGVSPAAIVGAIAYITGSLRVALFTGSQGMGASMVRLHVTLDRIRETAPATSPAGEIPLALHYHGPRTLTRQAPAHSDPGTHSGPGHMKLRDVRFGYGPHAAAVIDGLSLDIPPGDHLAVVGPSGVGKSSLAGLLAGLLEPQAGEILRDGRPVARCGPAWRVLIPQEAYVFEGTLAENLTYYSGADAAELDAAAEAVGLAPLLSRLGGYEATVRPGALSAGERQLIALTRAYLSPAPAVILDEATCHLDPAAEERAESAFARRGGTLVVVAHRITSALRARRILVLDGSSAQAGTHGMLLACSPMYRDLTGYWNAPVPAAAIPAQRPASGP